MDKNNVTASGGGFTLLELTIVMLIVGVITIGTFALASPILKKGRITATEASMKNIMEVLSVYVQVNNRLPCPADPDQSVTIQPYGYEIGSGANGDGLGDCFDTQEGIIPFRTLGVAEDEIKDGWKNYITYRVTPVFTLDPDDTTRQVHKRCRISGGWVFNSDNRNPRKARFCCPDNTAALGNDINISDGVNPLWLFDRDSSGGNYDDSETPYTGSTVFDPVNENVTTPAVILISHGANQIGAFLENGTRLPDYGVAGIDEQSNYDGDPDFIIRPLSSTQGGNYFDDLIMWRTQDQIYAETGKDSCMKP